MEETRRNVIIAHVTSFWKWRYVVRILRWFKTWMSAIIKSLIDSVAHDNCKTLESTNNLDNEITTGQKWNCFWHINFNHTWCRNNLQVFNTILMMVVFISAWIGKCEVIVGTFSTISCAFPRHPPPPPPPNPLIPPCCTGWTRLIRTYSTAHFWFELSECSN